MVISHPVDCEESTVQMLRQTLSASGFKEVKTRFEPIAAVMGYGIDHDIPEGQGILVFDFGGGTIDVAYAKNTLTLTVSYVNQKEINHVVVKI